MNSCLRRKKYKEKWKAQNALLEAAVWVDGVATANTACTAATSPSSNTENTNGWWKVKTEKAASSATLFAAQCAKASELGAEHLATDVVSAVAATGEYVKEITSTISL